MPYKLHFENTRRDVGFGDGGIPFGSHVLIETDPFCVVETKEQAREITQKHARHGVSSVYSVGYD